MATRTVTPVQAGQVAANAGDALAARARRPALLAVVITLVVAVIAGAAFSNVSLLFVSIFFMVLITAALLALRADTLVAAWITGVALLFDWYQVFPLPINFPIVATCIAVVFLLLAFFAQSRERPWTPVPGLWLWMLFLLVSLVPVLRGIAVLGDVRYYVTVFVNSALLYVVGIQVGRNIISVRRLLSALSFFAAFIGMHSLLQAKFGITLFESPKWHDYLVSISNYLVPGTLLVRAGSFLINPDSDGTFLAMMIFLPTGLFFYSTTWRARLLYAVEIGMIMIGLIYTYSAGALGAGAGGAVVFAVLVGYRLFAKQSRPRQLLTAMASAVALGAALFVLRSQVSSLAAHATAPRELLLRMGAWETGLLVIKSHPLTGVGLSLDTYFERAEPYRVALQDTRLTQPHNSFLEIAALGGLPVLLLFIAILGRALRLAIANFRQASVRQQTLIGGAFACVATLTFNSLVVNAWTLAPLAVIGWLVLGAIASPGLARSLSQSEPEIT